MPVIPTYRAKEQLDPGQAPQVRLSTADADAAAKVGTAMQGLGSQLGTLASHWQSKQDQQAKFDAGIQDDLRRADLTRALDEAKQQAPENGVGFHDSVLPKLDELAEKRFAAMPPAQAEQYRAKWQAERAGWSNELAKTERGIGGKYQLTEIDRAQQGALGEINANPDPAAVDAVRERVSGQIENASYLTQSQKGELMRTWGSSALALEAAQRFKADPLAASQALGIPLDPGIAASPSAVFSRMLVKENAAADPNAISPKGALGLAQVMPGTAREVATQMGRADIASMSDGQLRSFFAANPDLNKEIGRRYFGSMLTRFQGDTEAAVVAYNAGPSVAERWIKAGRNDSELPAETRDYKASVLSGTGVSVPVSKTTQNAGRIEFDGTKTSIGGREFKGDATPEAIAAQFKGMDERTHKAALSAFMEKACGTKIDPSKTAWCAAFADAVLAASGKDTKGSLRAADFLTYGTATNSPSKGDVVVFKSLAAGSSGHIGFVIGIEGDKVRYIAGNDGGKVQESTLPLDKVAGFRVPTGGSGLPDQRYSTLDFTTRQKLVSATERDLTLQFKQDDQERRAEVGQVKSLITDDLASVERTGKGMPEAEIEGKVGRVMGGEALQQWRTERARRFQTFTALDGIEQLPEAEIDRRLETLQPKPGSPGFADDTQSYTKARQKADKIVEARRADPALAVEAIPQVKQARANVQYVGTGDAKRVAPESAQAVVAARLAAQNDLGIETPMAVTRSEARVIARQLRVIGNEDESRVEGFVKSLRSTYGDFADEVLASTLQHEGVNRQLSILATDIMNKVASGQSPSVSQARQAEVLTDDKKLGDALRVSPRNDSPAGNPLNDIMGRAPEAGAGGAGPLPRSAFQTAPTFDARDIKGLVEGKVDPTDFDMKYGGQSPSGASWSKHVMDVAKKRLGGSGAGWQPGQPIKMSPELQSQAR